jgi:hypothetical protein
LCSPDIKLGKKKPTLCSLERSVEEIARKHHYAFEKDLWRGFLETTTYLCRKRLRKTTTLRSSKIWGGIRETPTVLSTEICREGAIQRDKSKGVLKTTREIYRRDYKKHYCALQKDQWKGLLEDATVLQRYLWRGSPRKHHCAL